MKRTVLVLGLLLCVAPFAPAQEKPVNLPTVLPTANLPADCRVWFKLPSLNRMDELAVKLKPLIELFDDAKPFAKQVPSKLLAGMSGLAETELDKNRSVIFAMVKGEMVAILPASPAATFAEPKELNGRHCVRRGPWFVIGEKAHVEAPVRETALPMPEGDIAVHVSLGQLIAENKKDIDEAFEEMKATPIPLPEKVNNLYQEALGMARQAVDQIESLEYSFTLSREGRLFSAGRVATKPRSKMREMLRASGKAGQHDLLRFLPRGAFMATSTNMKSDFLAGELGGMLDKHLGEGAGKALVAALGASALVGDTVGTRSASISTLSGMFNAGSVAVYELTDAKKAAEMLAAYDVAKTNELLGGFDLPVSLEFEKNVFEHDGVAIHRLSFQSDDPQIGMFLASARSLVAVDGGMLLTASGGSAKTALLDLIDRIRAGKKLDKSAHLEAIERLGDHQMAFTINIGAFKPLAMIFAMQMPEAAEIMNAIPDEMLMSTAMRMDDGDISWRGEWPLNEMKGLLAKIAEMTASKEAKKGLKEAEEEEDFD